MNIQIKHIQDPSYIEGLHLLAESLRLTWSDDGIPLCAVRGDTLCIRREDGQIQVTYPTQVALYRAMSYISCAQAACKDGDSVELCAQFDEAGVMIDLSRGGVMTVESVKAYLRLMAMLGLNQLYLYMEDTYEIEGRPYFGYMRGRYTADELREIDTYAYTLGIEAIPHIQTLGHMSQYIKWDEALPMRDVGDILLVGCEKTYEFIEDAIRTVASVFRTKKIHLGMDEANTLGAGRYHALHGARERADIMAEHMERVRAITDKYGLSPIVYGDMFSSIAHRGGYTEQTYRTIRQMLPSNMSLVHWEYDSWQYDHYIKALKKSANMTDNLIYFGGIWTWFGHTCDTDMSIKAMDASLVACKDLGIRRVAQTLWFDDGCECNVFMSAAALAYYAEHVYDHTPSVTDAFKTRFAHITGASFDAFMDMSYWHNDTASCQKEVFYVDRYFGKRHIWGDVLLGMMDEESRIKPMSEHYSALAERFAAEHTDVPLWQSMYTFVKDVCALLSQKCYLSEHLHTAYKTADRAFLSEARYVLLPRLADAYRKVCDEHRALWMATYKPFGFEVLDVRYGGMIQRIITARERLAHYLDGKLDMLAELSEPRLPHACEWYQKNFTHMVTACGAV